MDQRLKSLRPAKLGESYTAAHCETTDAHACIFQNTCLEICKQNNDYVDDDVDVDDDGGAGDIDCSVIACVWRNNKRYLMAHGAQDRSPTEIVRRMMQTRRFSKHFKSRCAWSLF